MNPHTSVLDAANCMLTKRTPAGAVSTLHGYAELARHYIQLKQALIVAVRQSMADVRYEYRCTARDVCAPKGCDIRLDTWREVLSRKVCPITHAEFFVERRVKKGTKK